MYRTHVRINLSRLQASPDYKPQNIKGIPPISKKRRHTKKRKNNIRRGLFLRAYGIYFSISKLELEKENPKIYFQLLWKYERI